MSTSLIGLVMGSDSDWPVMQSGRPHPQGHGVPYEARVVSAHRTPDLLFEYAASARERGLRAIIAGAGGAAHLPGMLAAKTTIPVLGVPIPTRQLRGWTPALHRADARACRSPPSPSARRVPPMPVCSPCPCCLSPKMATLPDITSSSTASAPGARPGAGAHPGGAGMILPPPLWVCSVAASSAATS